MMSEEICVQLKTLQGEIIYVQSHSNETLLDLINKINIQEDINSLYLTINDNIFSLEDSSYKTLSEMQIDQYSLIVLSKSQLCGTVPFTMNPFLMNPFNFNSLDTKIKLEFSKGNCKWRIVGEGISFIGICNSNLCEAYTQHAYFTLGFGEFDIRSTLQNKVVCPLCKKNMISVENFGFYMAQWKIKGTTAEGKEVKIIDKASERGYYTTFKEGSSAQWQRIKVIVEQLDKPEFVVKKSKALD
ncbi:hypothetical protein SteCoe_31912 [Stentor coeruleus]|uniref:Ubiquitin-like domain-containing protein n=1 Tax=Stentor coeruleus TaxID=5963 RepID=A0A1R2B0B6_9CILI|nr:hypothetical protein SteCoe_31912 [Stentor coeruleus]